MEGRSALARRLQLVLLLMVLWDILVLIADLSFGSPLLKTSDHKITGLIAGRAELGGAALVPMALYVYAIVRGPLRHPGLLWVGGFEQGAAALFSVFHLAAGDIEVEGA